MSPNMANIAANGNPQWQKGEQEMVDEKPHNAKAQNFGDHIVRDGNAT
jgi:hypothetical protein